MNLSQHNSSKHTEVAIIGAGIVGLAHALAAAKQGTQVTVFERNTQAVGASIRNFGMVWPIGQPAGMLHDRAMRSRQIWQEVAAGANFAIETCGSLHLAYRSDEVAVLEEFAATAGNQTSDQAVQIQLLTAAEVPQKARLPSQMGCSRRCGVQPNVRSIREQLLASCRHI